MNVPSVTGLLALNRFELDEGHPHISVDNEICEVSCTLRPCLTICPAEVYREHDGRVVADFAACLECGTCVIACPPEAISWHYPRGGLGVQYRYG